MLSSKLSVKTFLIQRKSVVKFTVRLASSKAVDEHSERKPDHKAITPELKKHLLKMGITNKNIV
jgi:hypothetical protein